MQLIQTKLQIDNTSKMKYYVKKYSSSDLEKSTYLKKRIKYLNIFIYLRFGYTLENCLNI